MTEIIKNGKGYYVRGELNTEFTALENEVNNPNIVKLVNGKYPAYDGSNITNITANSVDGIKLWVGTQTDYDNLGTYDSSTLYVTNGMNLVLGKIYVGNILIADMGSVASAIGDETSGLLLASEIINCIVVDKVALVNQLIGFGITANSNQTLSLLISLLSNIEGAIRNRNVKETAPILEDNTALIDTAIGEMIAVVDVPDLVELSDTSFTSSITLTDSAIEDIMTILVPIMTSNNIPEGLAFASTIYSTTFDAWKAFNGTAIDSNNGWITVSGTIAGQLGYQFTIPNIVTRYEIVPLNDSSTGVASFPRNWSFEGSNDGNSWDILDIQQNQFALGYSNYYYKDYYINNTTPYLYYRMNITANGGYTTFTSIGELRLA